MCPPGPDGLDMGFPVSGSWTQDGRHIPGSKFLLACTAGAIGKCIRFGYKPWKVGPHGERLWDYHQACTRMIRADYCGDGHSWTHNGTEIDLYDHIGINRRRPDETMSFEAAWGGQGAVCVHIRGYLDGFRCINL
jgi:hypothetical protein